MTPDELDDSSTENDARDFAEVVLRREPVVERFCPKCMAPLSSSVGLRWLHPLRPGGWRLPGDPPNRLVPVPLAERSRRFGEPREMHLLHERVDDRVFFKAGDYRCADRAACDRRYGSSRRHAMAAEPEQNRERDFINPHLGLVPLEEDDG